MSDNANIRALRREWWLWRWFVLSMIVLLLYQDKTPESSAEQIAVTVALFSAGGAIIGYVALILRWAYELLME